MKTTYLLLLLCFLMACKTEKTVDFGGTYVGDIRGNKLSMFLKTLDNNKLEGTIFDRGNNFEIKADVTSDVFKGQARDTSGTAVFDIEGSFHIDTLVVMMTMLKPQKSAPFPIPFKKVFINRSTSNEARVKDTVTGVADNTSSGQEINPKTSTSMHDDKVFGMWEIKNINNKKAPDIFSRNKYLFFNVNGSYSIISNNDEQGTLTPVKGKSWYTASDSIYIISTTDNYPAENLGKYLVDEGNLSIQSNNGKMIILQRK